MIISHFVTQQDADLKGDLHLSPLFSAPSILQADVRGSAPKSNGHAIILRFMSFNFHLDCEGFHCDFFTEQIKRESYLLHKLY